MPFVNIFYSAPSQYWWEEMGIVHWIKEKGASREMLSCHCSSVWDRMTRSRQCRIPG